MVYRQSSPGQSTDTGFVIKPNQAISWRSLMLVYLIIASITLAIGTGFYILGLTLVLPFSGVEILALGAALYVTAWQGGVQEVISISSDKIVIEGGRQKPEYRENFQRAWTKVILERSWNSWYPSRLLVCSKGRQLEIGRFLNEQERRGLAQELDKALT